MPSSNELLKSQKILNPKFKALSFSLIFTSIFIIFWSIFAKIPIYSDAIAYILPAFKLNPLKSGANGQIRLLSEKESRETYESLLKISTLSRLNKSKFISTDENILKLINRNSYQNTINNNPLNYLKINFNNIIELQNDLKILNNIIFKLEDLLNKKIGQKSDLKNYNGNDKLNYICYPKYSPIFYTYNPDLNNDILRLIDVNLKNLLNLKTNYNLLHKQQLTEIVSANYIKEELNIATDRLKDNSTPSNSIINLQESLYKSLNNINSIENKKNSLIVNLNTSVREIQNSTNSFLEKSFITAQKDSCITKQILQNKTQVSEGDEVGIAIFIEGIENSKRKLISENKSLNKTYWDDKLSRAEDLSNQIPFFYLADTDQGIRNKDQAIIYPKNISKSKYGGIKGTVLLSKNILIDENSSDLITGFQNIKPFDEEFKEGQTVYYGIIELEKNLKNITGFNWTGSNGPNFPILYGTNAEVVIKVDYVSPISKLFPQLN